MEQVLFCQDPVNLRRHRVFESDDIVVTRDSIAKVLQPHRLLQESSSRQRKFHLDHVPVCSVGLGAIQFGPASVHVTEIADYFLFLTCRRGKAMITLEGQDHPLDQSKGVIVAPGDRMSGRFSDDCEQVYLRITREALVRHTGLAAPIFRREVMLDDARLRPWLNLVSGIASDPMTGQLIDTMPGLSTEYERLLLSLLLAGQPHSDASCARTEVMPGCVKRAENFIRDCFAEPLTLEQIAAAARVSRRTLLDNFRRFRGVSPMRYLRDVRLDEARKSMISGETLSTAMAALESGIMHFGRFSRDYADRFGERPSETLRRAQRL
jgi:AraC-like DNA-binding protein